MDNNHIRYQTTFDTWNKVAQVYQDKFMNLEIYNETYDAFCSLVTKDYPKILEIWCGPGNITAYIRWKREDFGICAVDIAPTMVELAQKNNPSIRCIVMDGRNISHLNESFNAIIAGFFLPYLSKDDMKRFICDSWSLLAHSKGILYISFIEGDYERSGYQAGSTGNKSYVYYYTKEEIINELHQNYFDIIYSEAISYQSSKTLDIHIIYIAKKI